MSLILLIPKVTLSSTALCAFAKMDEDFLTKAVMNNLYSDQVNCSIYNVNDPTPRIANNVTFKHSSMDSKDEAVSAGTSW